MTSFWYSNPSYSYIRMNNLTMAHGNGSYREVFVTINGKFVGLEVVFLVIFTGGINPLFWEPIVAIRDFNLPSCDLDLTSFLGWLWDGKYHDSGIGVDVISFWPVNANLQFWLDHGTPKVDAQSVVYNSSVLAIQRREAFTFYFNGTYKIVQQRVKAKRDSRVPADSGNLVGCTVVWRQYPLTMTTSPRLLSFHIKSSSTHSCLSSSLHHGLYILRALRMRGSSKPLQGCF
ncbi:hypothetical protein CXB51_017499 [Gossypium anomalum]|uniref:Peptide N-acetyl-beta-D-glucosaminyl asparaginase amidase A N-terminal domain-containing protein n=1 Tax=Gossypium anomalum TaxID=47600 RepID=A0A8J5YUR3_9ROSI|nr:hypothetical protein CXB51_017499 [Gossypium anomalum]